MLWEIYFDRSNGYRAPESQTHNSRKLTDKSDVYSFGVLLLELLTGKCPLMVVDTGGYCDRVVDLPRWVQSVVREEWTVEVFDLELLRYKGADEEMVGLLQIALACTSELPDQRPCISSVIKMIEKIRDVQVSPSHDSVSDSPVVGSVEGGSGNADAKELSCTSFIDHKEGETCSSIAQEFNLTLDEFIGFNPNLNCNKLFVGEWLCLNAA
ncbi:Protein kinase domain-containing protein [Heracleum sosnowskyi]|uniref:Protein kinase domain-containing protein n=1 Tax=Heracleum sosnowskyi TaxID=360622 RepID=A0AAD8JCE6_9APIA|nr:Protein kinase domain-containing protein [Heracleum sosnowskyi]